MARLIRIVVVAVALMLAVTATAQEVVDTLPLPYEGRTVQEWPESETKNDMRAAAQVVTRFRAELGEREYLAVLRALADEFRSAEWPSHAGIKEKFQAEFDALVDRFASAQESATPNGRVRTVEDLSRVLDAMGNRGKESLLPDNVPADFGTVQTFFFETGNEFQTHRPAGDRHELLVPEELVRDMRLRGDAVRVVLGHFVAPLQDTQLEAIRRANRQWDNYLKSGYSQYPWEALFNSWVLNFDAFNPPDKQWVVFHPGLGLEFSTAQFDATTANEAVNVELLGFIGYYGSDNENFLGISAAAMLRDDMGPGIGPVCHFGENASIGVAWHDTDGNDKLDDDPFVFMSFDLFRLISSEATRFHKELDELKAVAETAMER